MTEQKLTPAPSLDEALQVLTVADLAAKLKVNKVTVRRWIKSGTLAAKKVGKEYRIPAAAVIKLVTPKDRTP